MSGGSVGSPGVGAALLRLFVGLAVVLLVALLIAGWFFADRLTAPATVRPFEPDTTVVAAGADTLTLELTDDLATGGAFGLQLPNDGYAPLTGPVDAGPVDGDATTATYGVEDDDGRDPGAGTAARVDEYWRIGTPAVVGLDHEDVLVPGPLGELPAWWVPSGDAGTVVFVHGRGGTREEALRFLPAIATAGWSTLVPTYRGDEGAPDPPGGRTLFGTGEWADLEAAVEWAVRQAPPDRPVVLFGVSMGGAVVGQFLDRSSSADDVTGVVLDSPVVSLDDTLDLQADLFGVPQFVQPALLPAAQFVADVLYGMDTATLEQAEDDGTFAVPTIVFHGAADDFVPWEQSLRLATRVRTVEHVAVEGAGHVRSWNVDRDRYEQVLVDFLRDRA